MGREIECEREGESDGERKRNDRERKGRSPRSHDHISAALSQLRWLQVEFRIINKLCILMNAVFVGHY